MSLRTEQIKELTLLLMYLQSWEESSVPALRGSRKPKPGEETVRRCWQGYDFDVLKELAEQGYIAQSGSKGPYTILTDGERQAEQFLKKYHIDGADNV